MPLFEAAFKCSFADCTPYFTWAFIIVLITIAIIHVVLYFKYIINAEPSTVATQEPFTVVTNREEIDAELNKYASAWQSYLDRKAHLRKLGSGYNVDKEYFKLFPKRFLRMKGIVC